MFPKHTLPLTLPLLLCACAEQQQDSLQPEARELFRESAAHIRAYTDSMSRAKDSVSWATLDRRFEERITRLNFKYPPDTDLHLSQGENDTLYILTLRYIKARSDARERILNQQNIP
ncbi:MAG: hypothetical protein K2O24_08410 [Muribaculaceae bacterium]|nr:hypothetical protein [Muribaculaceae bacterium]